MKLNIYLLLTYWMIIYERADVTVAEPLIGENVRQVTFEEFKFVGSLMHRISLYRIGFNTYHICTVALITSRHVLTAAHCFDNVFPNSTQIVIGSPYLTHGRVYYPSWFITYNQWSRTRIRSREYRINDVGVSKLTSPVHHSIEPATISTLTNTQLFGLEVDAAGWGFLLNQRRALVMRTAKLNIISNRQCEMRVRGMIQWRFVLNPKLICSLAEPFALLTSGDSGGPLIYFNMIIGISKATIPSRQQLLNSQKINIHIGIDHFREFIYQTSHDDFER